ncbi:MAG: hypothetical protein Q9159_005780 [Coniocarpon cinnabarinum]
MKRMVVQKRACSLESQSAVAKLVKDRQDNEKSLEASKVAAKPSEDSAAPRAVVDTANASSGGSSSVDDSTSKDSVSSAQHEKSQNTQIHSDDSDEISKPNLSDEDAKGWREFADMLYERYGEKVDALKKLRGEHSELEEDRDNVKDRLTWAKMDSQRNAEFFFENVARNDIYKAMIQDDDILRTCPLNAPEGLFEDEVKPTVIRVLDDKDMTRSVIVNLEGKAPCEDDEQADKQWDHVYDWISDLTKVMQQSDQISKEGFWTVLFSEGWYKCGFPAYSFPERKPNFPTDEVKFMIERLKRTSDPGMERYRVLTDKSHIRPFSNRLGSCSTTATVYPGTPNDEGKPRKIQVLLDTGAEMTIIAAHHIPKDVKILNTHGMTVSGFGGGSETLSKRVKLHMKLHGDDEANGIDIVGTAYVMDTTSSGHGVELGTDIIKPLGPTIDFQKSVMRIHAADGKTFETPIVYLREGDKIKEPTPQIEEVPASEEAPPEGKVKP